MSLGDKVLYNNETYEILFIYESGFCEIRETDIQHRIELVHLSELQKNSSHYNRKGTERNE